MTPEIDILLLTHPVLPRDTGSPEVYRPLRLEVQGQVATLPLLRVLAQGGDLAAAQQQMLRQRAAMGLPPVLTPFYLHDYMARRGLTLVDIPCLDLGPAPVEAALARGVGLIAISTTWLPGSGGAALVRQAAARLRALAPGIPVIAGGVGVRKGLRARALLQEGRLPGVTADALARHFLLLDARLDGDLDALVTSEGSEATLAAIARRLREGREFRDLPNLAVPAGESYRFTAEKPDVSDVDGEPVDWTRHGERVRTFEAPVRTAVGCPFRCEFCDFAGLYAPRLRSDASVVAELRTLAAALPPPRRVFFTDDNLALTRRRILEFTRALIGARLELAWRAFCRADAIDAEGAALMREAGCRECLLGIESGDPRILANMNKRLDLDKALEAIGRLDGEGICTQCTFVVGFPGETAASVERTAQFISALPSGAGARALHRYYLFRFELSPLCPAAGAESRARYGLTGLGEDWAHRTMNATEAAGAVREIFARVRGPTHVYLEPVPADWPVAATRRVMEQRDALQRERLGDPGRDPGALLEAVRGAERDAAARA